MSCRYNRQYKLCQPGPAGDIDPMCVRHENRCFTIDEYEKKTGKKYEAPIETQKEVPKEVSRPTETPSRPLDEQLRQPTATSRASDKLEKPIPISVLASLLDIPVNPLTSMITSNEGLNMISGPVSWYYFSFQDRDFHFFGDVHESKSGNCEKLYNVPCKKRYPKGEKGIPAEISPPECQDLTYFFSNLFDESKREKMYTDFFLEYPYEINTRKMVDGSRGKPAENQKKKEIDQYISSLAKLFDDCFHPDKKECSYAPYVRFHYADIRQLRDKGLVSLSTYLSFIYMGLLEEFEMIYSSYQIGMSSYQTKEYLGQLFLEAKAVNYIFDRLVSRGQTLGGKEINVHRDFFDAFLFSDQYTTDLDNIFRQFFEDAPALKQSKVYAQFLDLKKDLQKMTVNRNGKNMHRIRAQLDALRRDNIQVGGNNLATLIEDFAKRNYSSFNVPDFYNGWKRFYNAFERSMGKTSTGRVAGMSSAYDSMIDEIHKNIPEKNVSTLIESEALIMDAYILARMFRKFPDKGYQMSSTVFTYTGALHTLNYVNFFSQYLHAPLIDYQSNMKSLKSQYNVTRCLINPKFQTYF